MTTTALDPADTASAGPAQGRSGPPWRSAVELAAASLVAAVSSAVVLAVMTRLRLPFPNQVAGVLIGTGTLVAVLVLVLLATRPPARLPARAARVAVWSVLSALMTWVLALPLQGTYYFYAGLSVDQTFRTQMLTRFTASPAWADANYPGLPPFYSPAWFWVGGRLAALAGLPGWQIYKPWATVTMAVAGVVAVVLWRRVVRWPVAVLLGLATVTVGLRSGSSEPYGWLLVALVPPVAALTWPALAEAGPRRRWTLVGAGVFLGAASAVYTLYFALLVLLLVVMAAVGARALRRERAWGAVAAETAARLGLVALPALVIAAPLWGAYLVDTVRAGFPTTTAPRYIPDVGDGAIPFPMLAPTPFGVLCAVGTVWIVVALRTSAVARALATTVAVVYLWYVLSSLALVAGTTLLAFRFGPMLEMTLAAAGVLGGIAGVRAVAARVAPARGAAVRAAVLVLATAGAVSLIQPSPAGMGDAKNPAYVDPYPTGVTAAGVRDPSEPGTWAPGIVAAIERATPRPPADTVVLGGPAQVYAARPYLGFQVSMEQYANPLARYEDRNALIGTWAASPDAAGLVRRLDASPFAPPTVFVLDRAPDGLHLTLSRDVFPAFPNVRDVDVVFDPRLFAGPAFTTTDVGPFVVAVRR